MPADVYVTNILHGTVRHKRPDMGDSVEGRLSLTNAGELPVVQSLPPRAELTRQGETWDVRIASGDAFTHVAALPTTRAELVLHNGEPGNGKSYVVDQVYYLDITSITAAASVAILGQVVPGASAPTDDAAQLITSRSGRSNYGGNAKRAVAQTTMVANKWSVLATSPTGAAASIGLAVVAEVGGGIIVRPGSLFGVNVVVGTATGTAVMGIVWHEVQLPLG